MKRNRASLTVVVILAVIAASVSISMAGHGKGMGFGPPGFGIKALLHDLDLSDKQKESIAALRKEFRAERESSAPFLRSAMQQLISVSMQEEFDEASVREAYRAVSAAREHMVVARARFFANIRGVLTEEQIAEITARLQSMRDRLESRRMMLNTALGALEE